eukprot:1160210-Pelagomonas_calceolata.AAC.12
MSFESFNRTKKRIRRSAGAQKERIRKTVLGGFKVGRGLTNWRVLATRGKLVGYGPPGRPLYTAAALSYCKTDLLIICKLLRFCISHTHWLLVSTHPLPPSLHLRSPKSPPVPGPIASCPTCLTSVPPPTLFSLSKLQLLLPDVCVMRARADSPQEAWMGRNSTHITLGAGDARTKGRILGPLQAGWGGGGCNGSIAAEVPGWTIALRASAYPC